MTDDFFTEPLNDNFDDELEHIAIIGMSGRFPKAKDVDAFWQNLRSGVESLTYFTAEELIEAGQNPALVNNPNYVKARHILEDVDQFDAGFFDILPSEAQVLDPQHRLFLECAWEALETAGHNPQLDNSITGVFAGAGTNNYLLANLWSNRALLAQMGNMAVATASSRDFLPTRVAYKLNLTGATFNVQSACSTALVATHLACQHLLTYQCDMALAGGATVSPQAAGYLYQPGSPASPDGHCRPFDEKAEGTVFSNAVGVVVLKRLSEALADGDPIYCVIRGTAVNNDGATKVGFTAPSVDGELRAILAAQEAADVDPATISYIETHGTGTILGDPIEIEALTQAFRQKTDKKQFCAIGSAKGNIGHTDAAAGVCGLIKTALMLKNQEILPSINYEKPNPKIDFENSPFFVNTELRKWARNGSPRRAGVSAFGFGGTNAHLVLEEAPPSAGTTPSRRYQMLTLSAQSETALETMTDNLRAHLQAHPELDLADVAYTLHVGRADFAHRRTLICRSTEEAVSLLADKDPAHVLTKAPGQEKHPVAFMFSGQGSQYVNMGRDLYEQEPVFREQVDTCAELLRPHLGLDLRTILFVDGPKEDAETTLKQTWLTQPALFTVEYALAQLLLSWDIQPQAMIGHSIGEYVAACLAGVFSLEEALAIVSVRGQLMQKMEAGSMLAVPLTETAVTPYLSDTINLATINAPNRCVVAGTTEAINALAAQLEADEVVVRPLHTSHAFHSYMMEPMLETFKQRLQHIHFQPPQVPYISNLTGDWITAEQATDPNYWVQHVRQAVRFADGIQRLAEQPDMILLEVGPGTTLRTLAQRHPGRAANQPVMASMRHPKEAQADDFTLLKTLGQLWLNGVSFRWHGFYENEFRHRVLLPTYPFERQRFWIEPNPDADALPTALFKQSNIKDWFYVPSWKRTVPPVLERPLTPQTWLIFHNNDELSEAVLEQLRQLDVTAVSVTAGSTYQNESSQFVIRPAVPADHEAMWQTLHGQEMLPTHVLHLWNVTSDLADDVLDHSFYSLLYAAQAITKTDAAADVELCVVTSLMQQVGAESQPSHPEKATVLGVGKVISQEITNIHYRSVDVQQTNVTQLAKQLVSELSTPSEDAAIAYRGWERWVQTFAAAPVGNADSVLNNGLRDQGVYLITGGLGGIGLTIAAHLAESVRAKLVLTTRSSFPACEQWEGWLATHAASDRTSERIRQVQALEAAGADVLIVTADVADADAVKEMVKTAVSHFGTIHGIIHAAGVPGGGMIQLKTAEAAQAVLDPKIKGTRNLEAALTDQHLDFIMLCSSLAAVVGGVGQVDYCAANAFLDAYAAANNGRNGTQIVSVNWDAWAEVGMAVNTNPIGQTATKTPEHEKVPINHPILRQKYDTTAQETIYEFTLSPDKDWVVAEHIVMGIPTAPGTTHLELVRAAWANKTGHETCTIQEAIFVTPLMVAEGSSKSAQVRLTEEGDIFHFVVQSEAGVAADGSVQWDVHLMGEVTAVSSPTPTPIDLSAIINRCQPREIPPLPEDSDAVRQSGILFGPRWHSMQHAYAGINEALADIVLDDAVRADLEGYKLHPAILDIATSFGIAAETEGLYLPLSYTNFAIYKPFPARVFSYLQRDAAQEPNQEVMSVTVTLLDEQGQVLAKVDSFAAKRVRAGAATRLQAEEVAETAVSTRDFSMAISPSEGQALFARILARVRTPQIIISTRDLQGTIAQFKQMQENFLQQAADLAAADLPKHARPELATAFVAPRSKVEQTIATIWANALGVEEVGIRDNFFDLGGESILGIQIIAQLRKVGLSATPDQLFQHQTVAELAAAIKPDSANESLDELPVTRAQAKFLQATTHEPHLLVLHVANSLNTRHLQQAISHVWSHYDAFQMVFEPREDGWTAIPAASPVKPQFTVVKEEGHGEEADIQAETARLQHGFRTAEPPWLRVVYMQTAADDHDYVLLAVSPLVADATAVSHLAHSLMTAYAQLVSGEDVSLPPVTTTFGTWLQAWADAQPEAGNIYQTPSKDEATPAHWQRIELLMPEDSNGRFTDLAANTHTKPEELILAALVSTVHDSTGDEQVQLDWSQQPPLALDTAQTVGAMTVTTPATLHVSRHWQDDTLLAEVKEQIRSITLGDTAHAHNVPPSPYALTIHMQTTDLDGVEPVQMHIVANTAVSQIHFMVQQVGSRIIVTCHYNATQHQKQQVNTTIQSFVNAIQRLLDHALTSKEESFVPSDFPDAGLDQAALNQFISKLAKR